MTSELSHCCQISAAQQADHDGRAKTGGLAPDGEANTASFSGQTNITAFLPLFRASVA
jgi:hypothetical protein